MPLSPFVEKNGSRQREASASVMPVPVSVTLMRTFGPSARVDTVIVPPEGIASTALKMRFVSDSRSSGALARMCGTSVKSVFTAIVTPVARAFAFHFGAVKAMACSHNAFTSSGARNSSASAGR